MALLAWVLRDTKPAEVLDHLRRASLPGLLLATVLNLGHNIFRVWRWRALLEPVHHRTRFRPMFVAVILGYMTSWVVPGRIGELVRPMLLSMREPVPLGPAVGTVVADRVLDAATIVLMFTVGIWVTPLEGAVADYAPLLRQASLGMALVAAGALAILMLLGANARRVEPWLARRAGAVRWIGRTALSVSAGVRSLRSPRLLAQCVVHSILAWVTIMLATWIAVRSSGAEVGPGVILVILPLLALGVAVPTPGGAGSYHAAMRAGLIWFGVPTASAVSAGILTHLMIVIPTVVLGCLLLWTEGISWKEILSAAREFRRLGNDPGGPAADRVMETAR